MDKLEVALQTLETPPDFGWHGREDMFETWGLTMSNVLNSDDLGSESNFIVACELLKEEFGTDDDEHGPNIEIVGIKHWAVGSLDQIAVRVVKDDSDYCHHIDDRNIYDKDLITEEDLTPEFSKIIGFMEDLEDYPLLDEEHFSELEYERTYDYIEIEHANLSDGSQGWAGEVIAFAHEMGINPWDEWMQQTDVIEALVLVEMADMWNDDVIDFVRDHPAVMRKLENRKWLEAGQLAML